jgi:hypothetical protein
MEKTPTRHSWGTFLLTINYVPRLGQSFFSGIGYEQA